MYNVAILLNNYARTHSASCVNIDEHLESIYTTVDDKKPQHLSYNVIPLFYIKKTANVHHAQAAVLHEAQARFLRRKGLSLPDRGDLDRLWWSCQTHRTPPAEDCRMNYDDFLLVKKECEGKLACFFTPSFFLSFPRDEVGRIDIQTFMNFVNSRVHHDQTRLTLSLYDNEGEGFLTEPELENYIMEVIPSFPALKAVKESFMPFFLCTATRKFFFFLDKSHKGKISIKSLVTSPFLTEFFELQEQAIVGETDLLKKNWFSRENAIMIYKEYLDLDKDQNGMLSRSELSGFRNGALTRVVIERVFEEIFTYDGEMDYKAYLDFLLSMEFKTTYPALAYIFKLLDIKGNGYLTQWEINYFFKAILERMDEAGMYKVNVEDVIGEIFDMVHPVDPYKITLDDLAKCGVGDCVVSILIDVYAFIQYDSREASSAQPGAV